MNKEKLNQFTLDIEFLLISVVQAAALGALASAAFEPLSNLDFQYWPYILSGFLLILTFWAQAIVHSLSFIKWPLDLSHNFLYFLLGFIEFLSFANLQNPLAWFCFQLIFFAVAAFLYYVDLKLIKIGKAQYDQTKAQVALYNHIEGEQIREMKTIVPAGLIFNISAVFLIWEYPEVFITGNYHIFIVLIQVILAGYILAVSLNSFKTRSRLISQSIN